jgi:hypothetical protein
VQSGYNRSGRDKNLGHDRSHSVDEQLSRLDDDMRRLKIEYDVYFNGGLKKPPYETQNRVETTIKRMGDNRALTYAQRFRYNSLVSRYTSIREVWRRIFREREEGRSLHHAAQVKESQKLTREFHCKDAKVEVESVRQMYEELIEAKNRTGETVPDLTFPKFHYMVTQKAEALKKETGCQTVKFLIEEEPGKVTFRARPDSQE